MSKTDSLATLLALDESLKSIFLSAGTKSEFDFDLAELEQTCKQNNLLFSQKKIESIILEYCKVLKRKNNRVLNMTVGHPSSSVVRITFTIRLFGDNDSSFINPEELKTVVSSGEWRRASGERINKK